MKRSDSDGCSSYRRNESVSGLDKPQTLSSWKKYAVLIPIFINTALFPSVTHLSANKVYNNHENFKEVRNIERGPNLETKLLDMFTNGANPKNVMPYVNSKIEEVVNSEMWKKELELSLSNLSAFEDYIHEASRDTGLGVNFIKSYLALESLGNPYAVSRKGATGLGGLMEAAAKEVGIKKTRHIDERFDPKSIIGSARYMKKYIGYFDDVILGLIAYNWGPTRVYDNLDNIKGCDDLIKNKDIPLESRYYVVHVLARLKIFSDHNSYNLNFERKPLFSSMVNHEHVTDKDTPIKHLAKVFKVDEEELKRVNPSLIAEIIPKGTVVKIPHKI